jgi:hypothetical protein
MKRELTKGEKKSFTLESGMGVERNMSSPSVTFEDAGILPIYHLSLSLSFSPLFLHQRTDSSLHIPCISWDPRRKIRKRASLKDRHHKCALPHREAIAIKTLWELWRIDGTTNDRNQDLVGTLADRWNYQRLRELPTIAIKDPVGTLADRWNYQRDTPIRFRSAEFDASYCHQEGAIRKCRFF